MSSTDTPQRYVFTLVQGTRLLPARRSRKTPAALPWTDSNSKFCTGLREAFPGDELIIDELVWTGRNRALDRSAAAAELAQRVAAHASKYPRARQVVVGHSHGGTIACLALNEPDYARSVHRIICLSTPFIHVRPRVVGWTYETTAALPALLVAITTWVAFRNGLGPLPVVGSLIAGFVLWVFIGMAWHGPEDELPYEARTNPLLRERKQKDARLLRALTLPPTDRRQTLIIRVAGDEATGALAFARFSVWIANIGFASSRNATRAAAVLSALVLAVLGFWSFGSAWSDYPAGSRVPFFLAAPMFAVVLVVPVGMAVYSVVFLVVTGLLALPQFFSVLLLIGYGVDLWPLVTRFEFSVEDTPKGRHGVEQLSFVDGKGLLHSAAYDHAELPGKIRTWLRGSYDAATT